MDEKYVNRFLRREFRVIGWLLVAYYGIMNILAVAAVFSDVLRQFLQSLSRGQFPGNPDIHALMGNGWGYVATVAVGLLFLFCWKEDRFWKESVLASHGRMTGGVFAVLACLCMAAQLVNSLWIAGLELVMNQFDRSVSQTGLLWIFWRAYPAKAIPSVCSCTPPSWRLFPRS